MKLRKSLAALVAAAVMSIGVAGATNIGVVSIDAIAANTPSVVQGMQNVQQQYVPQLQRIQKELDGQKTEAGKKAVIEKNKSTLEAYNKARVQVLQPFYTKLQQATNNVRSEAKLDIIIDGNVVSADKDDKVVDVTEAIYKAMQ